MESIDIAVGGGDRSYLAWNALEHIPFFYVDANTSSTGFNSAVNGNHTETVEGWLSCTSEDGWGPLSSIYNDFTPCFMQGLLFGVSAGLMIIFGTQQIISLRKRKLVSQRVNWSFYAKLLLASLQFIFQLILVGQYHDNSVIKLALVLNSIATFVTIGLHYIEQFKSTIPNGTLLFYWLFQIILNLGRIINLQLRNSTETQFFTFVVLSTVNAFFILSIELAIPLQPYNPIKDSKISPYDQANIFSKITFDWMGGLMKLGHKQYLTEPDLPILPVELKASNSSAIFENQWLSQKSSKPSLFWALAKAFGSEFVFGGIFKGLQDCLAFVQPQLLRLLIRFVNDYSESRKIGEPIPLTKGLMISGFMFVVSVTQTACLHQYFQRAFDFGMKIKSSLTSVIYNKSLVLSNDTRQESSTGDIVNLMSVDVQRLQDLVQNLQIIWSGPFQIILCLYSLHGLLGKSMWAGVVIMLIMIPLNAAIARYQKKLQKIQMKNKDERSRLISEILNNIKSLKLYGWENPYLQKLNYVRNEKELANLKRIGVFSAFSNFTWGLAPFLVSCSTFAIFVYTEDRGLTTDLVFPALSLFNLLSFPLAVVPMTITNIVEAQVAISRLTKFLTGSELQSDAVIKLPRATAIGDTAVTMKNSTFLWSKAKGEQNYKVALSNINLVAKKGELDCIVGRVGSGKSSIIQAILGDLYKLDGEVILCGQVAYVSQVPWIMNGSIKENILFGHTYDPEFYRTVIEACALSVDLTVLPRGDKTEVGEKGISLSGGQKARLALARAVYARADVYLLDDPLSAVDEHVGKHLTDNVLGPNGLLKSKCRILATNNIKVLSIADSIHMVSDGRLIEQGRYDEIMTQENSKLYQLIHEFGSKSNGSREETPVPDLTSEKVLDDMKSAEILEMEQSDKLSLRRASNAALIRDEEADLSSSDEEDAEDKKLRAEHAEQGKVKWDVYKQYAIACNPTGVVIFLSCIVVSMALNVCSNVWLKHWSEVNTKLGFNPNVAYYLGVYFLLGIGYSAAVLCQTCIMWIFCSIQGSKKLHNDMAVSVLRAPMSFFETTPIGRILNRFSSDIYKIDEVLSRVFSMFFSNSVKVIFTIGVIVYSTWQFSFVIVPLLILYGYYQQYYLRTSRELRRLDSVSRSPIFANFQESLSGVSIIRAYGMEERFRHLNEIRVDKNMRAYHPAINANRWLAVRLEFLGSLIILGASGLSILTLSSGHISAGLVGLSVSYSLQITQSLNWIVRMTVEIEANSTSIERILEYSRLKSEAPEIIENNRPPKNWPQNGEVTFKNYSAKYRPELELVLKDINLNIKPREKIGIVGRTGAGKSTITLALFRIIEAYAGNIVIDSICTRSLGLLDVRGNLSIIPQDSQVFEGTIRTNLDPVGEYSDESILEALELAHLRTHVEKMFADHKGDDVVTPLDVKLNEGGSNLSAGQRQLMCLARVLVKMNTTSILVLDEATSAVDVETDKILQETIRSSFKDKTIITIAHRLNTILDSDRILVLEKGQIAEFDTPENLLKKKDSLFYSLAEQGGFIKDENDSDDKN